MTQWKHTPPIYLITGIMASGKSTVADLLARQLKKAVHLRGDTFRKMIVSGREEMASNPSDEAMRQLNLRYDIAAAAARMYHDAGFAVVWQDVMVGKALPEVISRLEGLPCCVIVLCPAPAAVSEREAQRGKVGYTRGFTPESFDALLRAETPRVGLWIDTTFLSPEHTVQEILEQTSRSEDQKPR